MTLLAVALGGRGIVDPDEPVLNADDEALLRGRAAFETTRVYAGSPFKLDEHLARLAGSAARIGLPPVDVEDCEKLARSALDAAGEPEAVLRLYWTAGREGSGRPTVLALVSSVPPQLERVLYTPALELGILAGVTRATLITEAGLLGYEVREGLFPLEHMAGAEEAFTSSSVREVMPAIELDGKPVGDGSPGEAARELQTRLRACASSP